MRSGEPWGEEVARLVLLTRDHRVESGDHDGALLIDADLGTLASPEPRYRRYVAGTRTEYAQFFDAQWHKGRSGFIRGLLAQEHIFFTLHGRSECEEPARANLQAELAAADLKDHMRT